MGEYINYFLFIVGMAVFFWRPKYAPLYYLAWNSFFAYFIDVIIRLNYSDNNLFESLSMNYIWMCCFVFVFLNNKFINNKKFIVFVSLFLCYVVFLGLVRSCLQPFQGWLRGYFCFIPLWIIIINSRYSFDRYAKYIYYMMILQLILAAFQQVGILYPSYAGRYAENGALNILGTFRRYNDFACGMSLLTLSYLSILLFKKKKLGMKDFFLVLISVFFVYRAGARTESLVLLVSLMYLLWNSRRVIRVKKSVWVLTLIFAVFLISTQSLMDKISGDNAARQQELVEVWNGERSLSEKTTLFLSVILLQDYISSPKNFLTGSGKLYKEGYGGWITCRSYMWDSDLALYLAETGIIGMMFYIFFLYCILKNCKNKTYPTTIMIFLILTSITDYGMFEGKSAIYFLFMSYFLSKDPKKYICKEA